MSGKVLVSRDVILDETGSWSRGEKHVKEGPLVEDPAFGKVDLAPTSAAYSPAFTSRFSNKLSSEYSNRFNSKFTVAS